MSPDDPLAIAAVLPKTTLQMACGPEQSTCSWMAATLLEITHPGVTALASMVSAIPAVREWLLPVQRKIGAEGAWSPKDWDIGNQVVFPQKPTWVFLDADAEVRATRRHLNWWQRSLGAV